MNALRLAVFASHNGSTLQAVIDACLSGELNARIVLVVSNNSKSKALQRARDANIETAHLSSATHTNQQELDNATLRALTAANADLVVLCGYMKKLGSQTLNHYSGRIVNTHPSLLPKYGGKGYYGRKVHEAVIAAGDTESGATVHEVEAQYDTGKVLAQTRVPVCPEDSPEDLEERVKAAEQQLLVRTLADLASKRQQSGR